MNMLDKHRILETGDEYLVNGAWKPVPSKDLGIQIMFSKYKQVRRPSEKENHSHNWDNKPISPSGEKLSQSAAGLAGTVRAKPASTPETIVAAKAESDLVTRPVVAPGAGERSLTPNIDKIEVKRVSPTDQLIEEARRQAEADARDRLQETLNKAAAGSAPPTESEKAMEKAVATGVISSLPPITGSVARREAHHHKTTMAETRWKEKDLIWTGRNGTFGCIGLEMANYTGDFVSLVPIGKRGTGNCIIQIPVGSIPVIVDWLNKQKRTTT